MISNASSSITKPATAKIEKRSYAAAIAWLAAWVVDQKRRRPPEARLAHRGGSPHSLYILGIQGSLGRGKSVFSQKLADALNNRLHPDEGRALARSLDDYYWPRWVRLQPKFLARGYHPAGISNRGPAGTHDLPLLVQNLKTMKKSSATTVVELPVFDKQADDRAREPERFHGRVGVFILEGWFVGAAAPVKPPDSSEGLPRSVALALPRYQKVFRQMDALWVFKAPSFSSIVTERIEQQKALDRQSGRRGMTPSQIRRFVRYFYKEGWIRGVTSPVPPAARVSFWATMDSERRWIKIRKGLKYRA